jgi:hypothetical protein
VSDIADASRTFHARSSAAKQGRCARVSVPVGSDAVSQSVPAQHTTVKGGNQDNGEESSQGREKEGRQEALSLPGLKGKRGAIVAPFFLACRGEAAKAD